MMGRPRWAGSTPSASGAGRDLEQGAQLVGLVGCQLGVPGEHVGGPVGREQHGTAEHGGDRVQPVLEHGDDAEVAATAPQRPEQIGVLVGAVAWTARRSP